MFIALFGDKSNMGETRLDNSCEQWVARYVGSAGNMQGMRHLC